MKRVPIAPVLRRGSKSSGGEVWIVKSAFVEAPCQKKVKIVLFNFVLK